MVFVTMRCDYTPAVAAYATQKLLLMSDISDRYAAVTGEVARLCAAYRRAPESVKLVAVGKKHSLEKIVALARLGQRDMAENFLQEGAEKIAATTKLLDENVSLCWHFIGHIQSRKCRAVAENFDWVHTVDSEKVATKLNDARENFDARLQVLLQVNLDNEANKSGVTERELPALAATVAELPNLNLRGLMIIPRIEKTLTKQRIAFRKCRELRDKLNANGHKLDHLSMGMSGDLEAAIAEGATMLRIGTALFGARPATP